MREKRGWDSNPRKVMCAFGIDKKATTKLLALIHLSVLDAKKQGI
jgi:hypothetical protein